MTGTHFMTAAVLVIALCLTLSRSKAEPDTFAANKALARAFLNEVAAGKINDSTVTADFSAWTATRGEETGPQFRHDIAMLAAVMKEPFKIEPIVMTAEDNRVAVEARSHGVLTNGEVYENAYHFLVTIEGSKVARVKSYFNTHTAMVKLQPVFSELEKKAAP